MNKKYKKCNLSFPDDDAKKLLLENVSHASIYVCLEVESDKKSKNILPTWSECYSDWFCNKLSFEIKHEQG